MDEQQNTTEEGTIDPRFHGDDKIEGGNDNGETSSDSCAKCEEYLAGWKRAQADYQNLKKEMERERTEIRERANERLLERLLPVLDQFSLAMQFLPDVNAIPESEQPKWKNWITGLSAVAGLWKEASRAEGLEEITATGAFDPKEHEAFGEEESDSVPAGHIVRTVQTGWKLHGTVIRPARVIVAKEHSSSQTTS